MNFGPETYGSPNIVRSRRSELECGPRRLDRNDVALRIEMAVGTRAGSDLSTPPPSQFGYGRGTIVFSELAYELESPPMGLAFTEVTADDGTRAAVCLFGGLAEYAEVLTDVTPQAKGWSAPATGAVYEYVRSRCTVADTYWGAAPELLAEILRIATRQGVEDATGRAAGRPWRRGFTYGHLTDVGEWFAEIFADVRVDELPGCGAETGGYDRIVVGAPLWIRTPSLRALTLYDEIPARELDLDIGEYE